MDIVYSKKVVKYIKALDVITAKRLQKSIERIPEGDIKKLQGRENEYRLRVGNLRVLYKMKGVIICITAILPRGQAYKRL